jgi:hypothetical protein
VLRQELFDSNRQRLQLRLFDDYRVGFFRLVGLDIEDTLTGLADGVTGDVITRVDV